jgi:hypothetical protein
MDLIVHHATLYYFRIQTLSSFSSLLLHIALIAEYKYYTILEHEIWIFLFPKVDDLHNFLYDEVSMKSIKILCT